MICIHFQEENFKICEDKTGGQAALSSMVYLYLAHIGSGFLLETEKDPGNQGFLWVGVDAPVHRMVRSSCHILTQVQRLVDHAFYLPHSEPGGPLRTCARRGIGVIWSALGASARRLMIKSRKRCYRRWVYRPGWGRRAGSTQRAGRRGPHTRLACSSLAGTERTGRKESHTGWACRSLADV